MSAAAVSEDLKPAGNRFRQAWTPERVVAAVRSWAQEFGQPPTSTEWEIGKPEKYAEAALAKARLWHEKAARFASDTYPSNDTVRRLFGSFNAALAAAGFEPRPVGRTPRELTDRQVDALRRRNGGFAAGPSQLANHLRSVMEARKAHDTLLLRAALYDLAAAAMAWCDSLPAEDARERLR